ncbi:MAG: hypothetical protein ACOCTQ_00690, partial [Planctomycetota bacterium]
MNEPLAAIRNGMIVTPDGVVEGNLVLSGGIIESVETHANTSHDSHEIIDAAGRFVLPGLVDLHV